MANKRRVRPQKPKNMGNTAYIEAMREIRSSNAAQPHRNRARYDRNDFRTQALSGKWD